MIFARTGKKLKAAKNGFYSYKYCRVKENCVSFNFSLNEIEIQSVKETTADQSKIEEVIRKVQKLLALADQSRNPSEAEAIAASMQAQKLLAKYNLEIADITGEEKKKRLNRLLRTLERVTNGNIPLQMPWQTVIVASAIITVRK